MKSFLDAHGLEVLDVTGRAYEPGLAVEVLDAYADAALPAGSKVIDETVSPIVLWRGSASCATAQVAHPKLPMS